MYKQRVFLTKLGGTPILRKLILIIIIIPFGTVTHKNLPILFLISDDIFW